MCKNWREKGSCRYGDRCLFAHGNDELTKTSSALQTAAPATPPTVTKSPKQETDDKDSLRKPAETQFETPKKKATTVSAFEIEQVASDSTRATTSVISDSKMTPGPVKEENQKTSELDFVLSGEIDDLLKVFLP